MNSHGYSAKPVLGTLAIAATVAVLLSGCTNVGFPAIHDMPAPRAETPLNPDQVKQMTDNLICEREHLATEASTTANAPPAANAPSACAPPVVAQPAVTGSTQPPSAYAKP